MQNYFRQAFYELTVQISVDIQKTVTVSELTLKDSSFPESKSPAPVENSLMEDLSLHTTEVPEFLISDSCTDAFAPDSVFLPLRMLASCSQLKPWVFPSSMSYNMRDFFI
jgi:hypothetical protein